MVNGQLIAPADTFEAFEERYKENLQPLQLTDELANAADLYETLRGTKSHANAATTNTQAPLLAPSENDQ